MKPLEASAQCELAGLAWVYICHGAVLTEANCVQLVIFLYLLDNETSTVVLFSAGIGTLIEFWKVTKAMKVSIDWSRGFPLPKFEDKAGTTRLRAHVYAFTLQSLLMQIGSLGTKK